MNKNETGRSMVEMMGVLAIMGILAITALKGFSMAMNKITAGKIADLVGEVSAAAQTRRLGGICLQTNDDILEELDSTSGKPKCVTRIQASRTGQVQVVFDKDEDCTSIAKLLGASFGKCRWDEHTVTETVDGKEKTWVDYGVFVPTRMYMCAAVNDDGTCHKWGECLQSKVEHYTDKGKDKTKITCTKFKVSSIYSEENPCADYTPDYKGICK